MHSTAGLATAPLCALLLQLADNVALFKPAADHQPLMLLPGRPPVPLPLDQPLMATAAAQQGNKVAELWQCVCVSGHIRLLLHAPQYPCSAGSPLTALAFLLFSPLPCCGVQIKLTVAFQEMELLPTAVVDAEPEGDNAALLRSAALPGSLPLPAWHCAPTFCPSRIRSAALILHPHPPCPYLQASQRFHPQARLFCIRARPCAAT